MHTNLKSTLESLLFVAAKPLTAKELSKFLEIDAAQVSQALTELSNDRIESGVVVLQNGDEFQLSTNSANSTQVKNFLNTELREKLTDATLEVLAIIAYRQPISKAEIEAIRGVNSQYSIRHLLMRGLIEKASNPGDARSFLYQTTTEFLQHLGLNSLADLPEFQKLVEQVHLPQLVVVPPTATDASADAEPALPAQKELTNQPSPAPAQEVIADQEDEFEEDEDDDGETDDKGE